MTQQPWPGTTPDQPQPIRGGSADDFFSGGDAGDPSFDWGATQNAGNAALGSTIIGVITHISDQIQQTSFADRKPLFYSDGSPRMQVVITLQTELRNWEGVKPDAIPKMPGTDNPKPPHEDTGLRRIFVKNQMTKAIRDACAEAGQKPRIGGRLAVKVSGFRPTNKGNPMTEYVARYQPAPEVTSSDAMFEQPQAQQYQQAPAQQYQQPPAQQYQQPPAQPPAQPGGWGSTGYDEPPF